MNISWPLFLWYFRSLRLLTAVTATTATSYLLSQSMPLTFLNDAIALFILAHASAIACLVSPSRRDISLFLFSQGFSRQTLWLHSWLAAFASVALTLLPCAILILCGLRSWIEDTRLNPWFPLMSSAEMPVLGRAVVEYLILLPALRYVTIRLASPDQDFRSGVTILVLAFIIATMTSNQFMRPGPFQYWYVAAAATISIGTAIVGYPLMKRTEVC